MSRRRNSQLSAIEQLPAELLIKVWKDAVPETYDYYEGLRSLRLTSGHWAAIIDNEPTFWTTLPCSLKREQMLQCLERSRNRPVDITFLCKTCPYPEGGHKYSHRHDHNDFLQVLREHPPEQIRRMAVYLYQKTDWDGDLGSFLFFCGIPTSELELSGRGPNNELRLNGDFLHGVGSKLEALELKHCHLPSDNYHPLPNLRSCIITESVISPSTALRIISTASASLEELSITACQTGRPQPLDTDLVEVEVKMPRLRRLRIEGNASDRIFHGPTSPAIGLANLVDHISAPRLESLRVRQDYTTKAHIHSIETWLAQLSQNAPSPTTLTLELNAAYHSISYGNNFYAQEFRYGIRSVTGLALELIKNINPSSRSLITFLNLVRTDCRLLSFLQDASSLLPSITDLATHDDDPFSWPVLSTRSELFPNLSALHLHNLEGSMESELVNLLQARARDGGLKRVHVVGGKVSQSVLDAARSLGLVAEMTEGAEPH